MFCIAVVGKIECLTRVQSVVDVLEGCPALSELSLSGDNTSLCTLVRQIAISGLFLVSCKTVCVIC